MFNGSVVSRHFVQGLLRTPMNHKWIALKKEVPMICTALWVVMGSSSQYVLQTKSNPIQKVHLVV